jgi:putative oxidoreductase
MNIKQCKTWIQAHEDIFMDLVRIYLGVGLFIKGIFFMMHRDYLIGLMDRSGNLWFAPAGAAHYVVPAHLVGGVLLALGLLTRVAAVAQIPVLLGAIFYVYLPRMMQVEPVEARQNLEFSALVLFLLMLISIYGAGRWSVDYLLTRKDSSGQLQPSTAT